MGRRKNQNERERERERKPLHSYLSAIVYCFVTVVIYLSFVKINSRIAVQQKLVHIQHTHNNTNIQRFCVSNARTHTPTHTKLSIGIRLICKNCIWRASAYFMIFLNNNVAYLNIWMHLSLFIMCLHSVGTYDVCLSYMHLWIIIAFK